MGKKIRSRKIYYYVEEEDSFDKKKLWYLLLLLVFTGILLSSSTYAWFTTNRVVSVKSMDVKVRSEGSIEISSDAVMWKASIGTEEIIGAHSGNYPSSVNQLPNIIDPVSTGGNLSSGKLEMFLGTVMSNDDGDYILTSKRSIETESNGDSSDGNFVAFDLFLRTNEAKTLYITNESKISYNGTSYGTENAMRVAFVVEGNVSYGSSPSAAQALTTNDKANVYIWEPNNDTHTSFGIANAKDVYGITTSASGAVKLNYDGVIAEISQNANVLVNNAKASNYSNYFATVNPKFSTASGYSGYQQFINLGEGITKIRVYLWMEGQDVDCENNASVGNISFQLQFSTNPS